MTKHLYHWRKAEGLTQTELADRLGVRQPTIAKWESGQVPAESALIVHTLTGIALHKLRPDIYPEPKRESAG